MFYPIIAKEELKEGLFKAEIISEIRLLLIHHHKKTYIIENKCGHFGMPLETGSLEGETIVCSHHGISFNLTDGEISNRPYENCGSIRVFEVVKQDGFIGVEIVEKDKID